MKTREFLQILENHQNKVLVFEYKANELVGANYHITEVKNITVESVDCGARTDYWKETVVQLWESPNELDKTEYMPAYKAFSILKKVNKMRTMDPDVEIKFEYGNSSFHTAQLFVNDYEISDNQLLIKLAVQKTDCKAREECGVPEPAEVAAACCEPEGKCC